MQHIVKLLWYILLTLALSGLLWCLGLRYRTSMDQTMFPGVSLIFMRAKHRITRMYLESRRVCVGVCVRAAY